MPSDASDDPRESEDTRATQEMRAFYIGLGVLVDVAERVSSGLKQKLPANEFELTSQDGTVKVAYKPDLQEIHLWYLLPDDTLCRVHEILYNFDRLIIETFGGVGALRVGSSRVTEDTTEDTRYILVLE